MTSSPSTTKSQGFAVTQGNSGKVFRHLAYVNIAEFEGQIKRTSISWELEHITGLQTRAGKGTLFCKKNQAKSFGWLDSLSDHYFQCSYDSVVWPNFALSKQNLTWPDKGCPALVQESFQDLHLFVLQIKLDSDVPQGVYSLIITNNWWHDLFWF